VIPAEERECDQPLPLAYLYIPWCHQDTVGPGLSALVCGRRSRVLTFLCTRPQVGDHRDDFVPRLATLAREIEYEPLECMLSSFFPPAPFGFFPFYHRVDLQTVAVLRNGAARFAVGVRDSEAPGKSSRVLRVLHQAMYVAQASSFLFPPLRTVTVMKFKARSHP